MIIFKKRKYYGSFKALMLEVEESCARVVNIIETTTGGLGYIKIGN